MSSTASILSTPTGLTLDQLKDALFQNIRYRLGDGIIDLELDPGHYEAAYNYTIKVYRQRAQNATAESYTLMRIEKNVDTYTLPQEFINVKSLFRRTVGLETGPSSSSFDPFSSAILNTYLLNYNYAGGMATYDFYAGYVELAARMFGGYVIYTFDPVSKVLRIVRDPKGSGEQVLIWADVQRTEEILLQDPGAGVWIGDFVLAILKGIIGEAREKFATIAGPGGGTTLNGAAMKAESKELQLNLIEDLKRYVDYSQPLTWVQG
ncbi:MAG: hypothetical protein ACOVLB_04135 [Candidatus Nanopelagicus sp.]